jgi:hypothetical protein
LARIDDVTAIDLAPKYDEEWPEAARHRIVRHMRHRQGIGLARVDVERM